MGASFSSSPRMRRYVARRPAQAGNHLHAASAPLASLSARQQLGEEDLVNERDLNRAIWKSVKGATSRTPAPMHRLPGSARAVDADD